MRTTALPALPAPGAGVVAFVGEPKKRKRSGPPGPTRAAQLFEQAGQNALSAQPVPMTRAADLVALYGWLHREVYGVVPAELSGQVWNHAVAAARRMIEREFGGDYAAAREFVRWVWARERDALEWRRRQGSNGSGPANPRRIGWSLQFQHGGLLTDYRVANGRRAGLG